MYDVDYFIDKFEKIPEELWCCPCCDKTFKVLSKHLVNKHPEFKQ
jgi:hypothetical protein